MGHLIERCVHIVDKKWAVESAVQRGDSFVNSFMFHVLNSRMHSLGGVSLFFADYVSICKVICTLSCWATRIPKNKCTQIRSHDYYQKTRKLLSLLYAIFTFHEIYMKSTMAFCSARWFFVQLDGFLFSTMALCSALWLYSTQKLFGCNFQLANGDCAIQHFDSLPRISCTIQSLIENMPNTHFKRRQTIHEN